MRSRRPNNGRNITFLIGSLQQGGAESQLVMLAEQLAIRGWQVNVFALHAKGSLQDRLERARIGTIDGGYDFGKAGKIVKLAALLRSETRLLRHLVQARPQIVHAFLPLTNFLGAIAGRIAFRPVVITSRRGLGRHQDKHPQLRWMDRVANALSDSVTANSQAVAEDTEQRDGLPAARITVIPNGLDFSRFEEAVHDRTTIRRSLGLRDGEIGIVKIANLIPYKGHGELIEAFSRLVKFDKRLKLFLVGDDRGIGEALVAIAARFGVEGAVKLMGSRSDITDILCAMDLGVMASHEEGFSNALLEKLAAGLPVVATDVGGNPEALRGMADCLLARPKDPEDLARAMGDIIARIDAAAGQSMMRQRLVKDRWSVTAMVDAYERLYETRLAGGGH